MNSVTKIPGHNQPGPDCGNKNKDVIPTHCATVEARTQIFLSVLKECECIVRSCFQWILKAILTFPVISIA